MNIGIVFATSAYVFWGLFPLYFTQVAEVPSLEVVLHRTVWAMVFILVILTVLKRWAWIGALRHQPRVLSAFALSALLLSTNWLVYVWAVKNGHVLDASLGYFMLPLINVALGLVFLNERPRRGQWFAVGVAATGVLWLALQTAHFPWVALVLALTFGFYGLMRKTASLGALEGLALETMMLAPLGAAVLGFWTWRGQGVLAQGNVTELSWLVLAGPLTAIPLLLFAAGARRIPMTTMGILQYISPTLQFALGIWAFNEPLQPARLFGFALIWIALVIYTVESGWMRQRAVASTVAQK
ncbi:MAG: EamA family transporter RarD [Rhodoferax sp.]|nr:EamA family transporter RarD [Rhodoferax sp.]MBP7492541.1 EamA family transporter RarD [Rhodoferax sp.]